jgi:hypothetical protein
MAHSFGSCVPIFDACQESSTNRQRVKDMERNLLMMFNAGDH